MTHQATTVASLKRERCFSSKERMILEREVEGLEGIDPFSQGQLVVISNVHLSCS